LASSLAFALSDSGWEIHAIASRQLYNDSLARTATIDRIRGVAIHRLWTTRLGRRRLAGRAVDYLTFYVSAYLWLIWRARRGDVIVALTDPPLMSVLSTLAANIRGCRHINWLQDIFPEVACALGVVSPNVWSRAITWLRNRSLRHAAMNVAIGDRMADHLERQGVHRSRITVIHNWSDSQEIQPCAEHGNALRHEWGLKDKFVVGYSGNLGRAHDYTTILLAADKLRDDDRVCFLFIGGGHFFESLKAEARRRSLTNIVIKPYQCRSRLREILGLPDLHLISLQPALEGLIVPSKFYGIAAAGRPTIFIGDPSGEIPEILSKADCGAAVAIGDEASLIRHVKRLQHDTAQRQAWGRNARTLLQQRFDRPQAIARWIRLLEGSTATAVHPRESKPREPNSPYVFDGAMKVRSASAAPLPPYLASLQRRIESFDTADNG
jgi:glycosyltransferase involved in cell wall biosynthesis